MEIIVIAIIIVGIGVFIYIVSENKKYAEHAEYSPDVFGLCVWAGFGAQNYQLSTKLDTKHKAPSLHVIPPDAKPVLAVVFLLSVY